MTADLGIKALNFRIRRKAGYTFAPSMDLLFDGNRMPSNLKFRERVLVHELALLREDR